MCVHFSIKTDRFDMYVEHGRPAVERSNRGSMGSKPLCCYLYTLPFLFSPRHPSSLSCINENLAAVEM